MVVGVGIALALAVAVLTGVRTVLTRMGARQTDEYVSAWAVRAFGLPILFVAILYDGIPKVTGNVILLVLISGVLGVVATVVSMRSFMISDASLVSPLASLSPAVVLLTEPLLTGDFATPVGAAGVLLTVAGAYFLENNEDTTLLEPFVRLAKNRGVQFMIVVVLIHSITSPIDSLGVDASTAVFWSFSLHIVLTAILFPLMLVKTNGWRTSVAQNWRPLISLGLFSGLSSVLQMVALTETLVVYVTGIKRLSIPIGVVLVHLVFDDEENFRGRIVGSLIMVVGILFIALADQGILSL